MTDPFHDPDHLIFFLFFSVNNSVYFRKKIQYFRRKFQYFRSIHSLLAKRQVDYSPLGVTYSIARPYFPTYFSHFASKAFRRFNKSPSKPESALQTVCVFLFFFFYFPFFITSMLCVQKNSPIFTDQGDVFFITLNMMNLFLLVLLMRLVTAKIINISRK